MVVYSSQGGMDIEAVAAETPDLIFKEEIHPLGLQTNQARRIAFNLGLKDKALSQMVKCIMGMYDTYIKNDLSLLEINPLVKTANDDIFAVDAKIAIEDNALYRHPNLELFR